MKSLLLVCLLVVTLTVAIAAPAQESSGTRKQKKKCAREPDSPQKKCKNEIGSLVLLDNSEGHAAGVLERFRQMEQQVERTKRSRDVFGSRTPLDGKKNDRQASAVWKRIHGKTPNETTADPVLM
ncbi:hypothetical protein HHUSO_G5784 [Huso huso]|uniref:Uncharacterized protein n=1 Tax=Huso huso TaxID=61971 RepID=A0ABR1A2A8_HUSHU